MTFLHNAGKFDSQVLNQSVYVGTFWKIWYYCRQHSFSFSMAHCCTPVIHKQICMIRFFLHRQRFKSYLKQWTYLRFEVIHELIIFFPLLGSPLPPQQADACTVGTEGHEPAGFKPSKLLFHTQWRLQCCQTKPDQGLNMPIGSYRNLNIWHINVDSQKINLDLPK